MKLRCARGILRLKTNLMDSYWFVFIIIMLFTASLQP